MSTELEWAVAASLDATPDLLPWIPELLADLWALGSSPEEHLAVLRHAPLAPGARALDLGCGKGASAVALARELGLRVDGVDGFGPFVDEARARAAEHGVEALCSFERGELLDALARARDYDLVLFAAGGPELGGRPCVERVRGCVREGGWILVDDGFLPEGLGVVPPGYEGYRSRAETLAGLTASGDELVFELLPDPDARHAAERRNTELIRGRARALAKRHPERAASFEGYADAQAEEVERLRVSHVPALWLLRRGTSA